MHAHDDPAYRPRVAAQGRGTVVPMTVLLGRHDAFTRHDTGRHHPERADRLLAVFEGLSAAGLDEALAEFEPRPARREELTRVHEPAYLDALDQFCSEGGGMIDADTRASAASYEAALCAAGAGPDAVCRLRAGEAEAAFLAVRPPGHHALSARAMGFCLFNNVAVAAQHAIAELGADRVLIVDFDVHHGNGTAEIFRSRSDVLYASIHRGAFYPGTGPLGDLGSGAGAGFTINLPVDAGTEGPVWLSLLEHIIVPAAWEFSPTLILLSAGFDAHRTDPLGGCRLENDDYAQMFCILRDLGTRTGAPVGAVLEGGYAPQALADGVLAGLGALLGEGSAPSIAPEPIYTPRAAAVVGRHWRLQR